MKVIVNTIYLLGFLIMLGFLLIFFKVFSKDTFENLTWVLMTLYAYLTLILPLFSSSRIRKKAMSLLSMVIFPLGLLYPKFSILSLIVLFFCVYLSVDQGNICQKKSL
jgi:hypothetical protein